MIGMIPMVIPTFSNTWNTNIDRTPTQMRVPSGSRASWAVRQMRQAMIDSSASSVPAPMKPSSSPTAVKMKSVCCSGTMSRRVWVPLNEARAGEPAGADGDLGLLQVVRGAPLGALLVLRLEERGEPALLVLLEHPGVEDHAHADDADEGERGDVPRLGAADEQHPHADGDEHERGAEVGLQHDQRHRHAGDRRARSASRRASSSLSKWAMTDGQRDDHDDLGELGRLELERPELEPRLACPCARCRAR